MRDEMTISRVVGLACLAFASLALLANKGGAADDGGRLRLKCPEGQIQSGTQCVEAPTGADGGRLRLKCPEGQIQSGTQCVEAPTGAEEQKKNKKKKKKKQGGD
jgi:hypothetical protein